MPYKNSEKHKQYQKQYASKHYQQNKAVYLARARKNNDECLERNLRFVYRIKRRFGCSNCKINNPVVIDFHHLRDKEHDLSQMIRCSYGRNTIKNEMRKCILLCANCHRIVEHEKRLGKS